MTSKKLQKGHDKMAKKLQNENDLLEKIVDKETGLVQDKPKPQIKTQFSAHLYPNDHEVNLEKSKTVPNQTMTILQMIQRHRKGLPIDESKGALYQGDELVPDISKMDLVDRQNYIDSVADALVEVRARLEEQVKTNQQKEWLKQVDTEVRKRMADIKSEYDRKEITDVKPE